MTERGSLYHAAINLRHSVCQEDRTEIACWGRYNGDIFHVRRSLSSTALSESHARWLVDKLAVNNELGLEVIPIISQTPRCGCQMAGFHVASRMPNCSETRSLNEPTINVAADTMIQAVRTVSRIPLMLSAADLSRVAGSGVTRYAPGDNHVALLW